MRESNEHARPAKGSQVKLMMMRMMMKMMTPVADAKRMNVKLGSASGKTEPESEPNGDSNCEAAMNSKEMPDKQEKKTGMGGKREKGAGKTSRKRTTNKNSGKYQMKDATLCSTRERCEA